MFTPTDDTNTDIARHQELLDQSQHYPEMVTSLKKRISIVYKLFLAYAGKKMVVWGYQIHKKSGAAAEFSLRTPPYAMENRG